MATDTSASPPLGSPGLCAVGTLKKRVGHAMDGPFHRQMSPIRGWPWPPDLSNWLQFSCPESYLDRSVNFSCPPDTPVCPRESASRSRAGWQGAGATSGLHKCLPWAEGSDETAKRITPPQNRPDLVFLKTEFLRMTLGTLGTKHYKRVCVRACPSVPVPPNHAVLCL